MSNHTEPERCPECGGETEEGFGLSGVLAGVGYDPYRFCMSCGKVVSKTRPSLGDDAKRFKRFNLSELLEGEGKGAEFDWGKPEGDEDEGSD